MPTGGGSALPGTLYHGTSHEHAESIRQHGFDLAHHEPHPNKAPLFKGVYLTQDPNFASQYGGDVLKTEANVHSVGNLEQIVHETMDKHIQIGTPEFADRYTKAAMAKGYEAVSNGREAIVFDPAKVAVVK